MFISPPSKNITFNAGLTINTAKEIKSCNITEITQKMANKNIKADFNNDKLIAWCCLKVVNIFDDLNKNYKLNLALPKAIYVKDFSKLNVNNINDFAYCNFYPLKDFIKGSNQIIEERTLFFNKNKPWNRINTISNEHHRNKNICSNHFLTFFTHEFCHSAHCGNLFKKFKDKSLLSVLNNLLHSQHSLIYKIILSKISLKSTINPADSIAEDMTARIIKHLDIQILLPQENPFKTSLYLNKQNHFFKIPENDTNKLKILLNSIWEGSYKKSGISF